mmetsp:Transcript_28830/g.27623  ORF Transcript_28830/g.27623 Transcript_28830/m.27623 type:complete len:551 (+) Transcript_28830:240-1892(+)
MTFNKTTATQMKMQNVTSRSIHSWAFYLLNVREDDTVLLKTDTALEEIIRIICGKNISNFLQDMPELSKTDKKNKRQAEKLVRFYIMKTFTTVFLHSAKSVEEGFDHKDSNNVYYPARKWHQGNHNNKPPKGVPTANSKNDELKVVQFYVQNAKLIWNKMSGSKPQLMTFDSVVKRAQLQNIQISGSVILMDEAQDSNECSNSWICKQASSYHTQTFIVGDSAQAIYGFRGAKPAHLLAISNKYKVIDCELTESYRFGPEIAAVANVLLNGKENSPQTIGQPKKSWNPYRMTGVGASSFVTSKNLIDEIYPRGGGRNPVTIIAFKNMELLDYYLKFSNNCHEIEIIEHRNEGSGESSSEDYRMPPSNHEHCNGIDNEVIHSNNTQSQMGPPPPQLEHPPYKISLFGEGESSGKNNWIKVKNKLIDFFNIFKGCSSRLKYRPWSDVDEDITWNRVRSDVETFDLNEYSLVIELIDRCQHNTLLEYSKFEDGVMNATHSLDEADIILTTVHAAKGMEWDRVMVLDGSLKELSQYKIVTSVYPPNPNPLTLYP